MKLIFVPFLMIVGAQFAMAQSTSTRVKTQKVVSSTSAARFGDYRLNMTFNNSRIAGNIGSDQNKLRETGFELVRIFNWKGMSWESGLSYETLGGRLIDGSDVTDIKITYFTIPMMARNQLGRVGGFEIVGLLGGKLAIQSTAEAKFQDPTFPAAKFDLEENIEEYDLRAAIGISLESKSPKTLGFSTGIQWQRGLRNIVEGTGPKFVTDSLAFNVGMMF